LEERLWEAPALSDWVREGRGRFMLQSLPAAVVGRVVGPKQGDKVLDMCAAPGGKTTHMAVLMGGKGHVVACDRSKRKVQGISELAESQELQGCVEAMKAGEQ